MSQEPVPTPPVAPTVAVLSAVSGVSKLQPLVQPLVVVAIAAAVSVLCALSKIDGQTAIALLAALAGHGLAKVAP